MKIVFNIFGNPSIDHSKYVSGTCNLGSWDKFISELTLPPLDPQVDLCWTFDCRGVGIRKSKVMTSHYSISAVNLIVDGEVIGIQVTIRGDRSIDWFGDIAWEKILIPYAKLYGDLSKKFHGIVLHSYDPMINVAGSGLREVLDYLELSHQNFPWDATWSNFFNYYPKGTSLNVLRIAIRLGLCNVHIHPHTPPGWPPQSNICFTNFPEEVAKILHQELIDANLLLYWLNKSAELRDELEDKLLTRINQQR